MHEPTFEELKESFDENVQWLRTFVPPEDIHPLTQQMIMTAEFFLGKWQEWVDVEEELKKNPRLIGWIRPLVRLKQMSRSDSAETLHHYLRTKGFG